MSHKNDTMPIVLLTGASGYVGGELLRRLQSRNLRIRCLMRRPEASGERPEANVEFVRGDVLDPASLAPAMQNVDAAYYLVHSMSAPGKFETMDRDAARNFAAAAQSAGVRRILYLGGLGDESAGLSSHLRSRQEVGEILRAGTTQVIEFRTSIVIGRGSFSFEMIRALTERLPVMITPRWVATPTQPIAIGDLLDYLIEAFDKPVDGTRIFEIGGADQTSYGDLMREYARQRGLRRLMVPVPVLSPRLSSLWLRLVTPYHARIGKKLIAGLQNKTVVRNREAERTFQVRPLGLAESIARALAEEDGEFAEGLPRTLREHDSRSQGVTLQRFGNRFVDHRFLNVSQAPESVFACIERIGGKTGWYYGNWLWSLRGFMDRLSGGVGMRRGRRDPDHLKVGDALDFWRVEALEPHRRLRLIAEMKLPGRAWLEFQVESAGPGTRIQQSAIFDPKGLLGLAYWYAVSPLHHLIFAGMLHGIARAAAGRAANADIKQKDLP